MEYGMTQAGSQAAQPGMNIANQPVPPMVGLLSQAREAVVGCQQMLNELHKFADQFVGIRGEDKGANAPAPVPNGSAEELRDSIMHLQGRLSTLCMRLSVL